MAQQGYEDDLLRQWFPASSDLPTKTFTENDIRGIADVLGRNAQKGWSRIPRIFSVLKLIDQVETIDAFIDEGITDHWFPFSKSSLPEGLRDHSARLKFLEVQEFVYNAKALELERQRARHGHFRDPNEVPLKKTGELGKGGFGYVDRVVSTVTHKEYARKLISRGKTFRKDKQILHAFVRELSNLKRVSESHHHLVNLVGSYTDPRFVAIIMLPVADCNLQVFLERPDLGDMGRSQLRPFFGCLTSALSYLHDNRIRHKDIKPSNVLIKDDQLYLTDFGTSLDWSELGNSTTASAPPTTPRYCAPEVMAWAERNTLSDIWSLGCVFLEMLTVLKQRTLDDLKGHMTGNGTHTTSYHSNVVGITTWLDKLKDITGPPCDNVPLTWIVQMLQEKTSLRWSVHILEDRIHESSVDPSMQYAFCGLCCMEEDDASESVGSSVVEHKDDVTLRPQPYPESSIAKAASKYEATNGLRLSEVATPSAAHTPDQDQTAKLDRSLPSIIVSSAIATPQAYVEEEAASLDRETSNTAHAAFETQETMRDDGNAQPRPVDSEYDSSNQSTSEAAPTTRQQAQASPRSPSVSDSSQNVFTQWRNLKAPRAQQTDDSRIERSLVITTPPKQANRAFAPTRFGAVKQPTVRSPRPPIPVFLSYTEDSRNASRMRKVSPFREHRRPDDQTRPIPSSSKTRASKPKDSDTSRIKNMMRGVFGSASTEPSDPATHTKKKGAGRSSRTKQNPVVIGRPQASVPSQHDLRASEVRDESPDFMEGDSDKQPRGGAHPKKRSNEARKQRSSKYTYSATESEASADERARYERVHYRRAKDARMQREEDEARRAATEARRKAEEQRQAYEDPLNDRQRKFSDIENDVIRYIHRSKVEADRRPKNSTTRYYYNDSRSRVEANPSAPTTSNGHRVVVREPTRTRARSPSPITRPSLSRPTQNLSGPTTTSAAYSSWEESESESERGRSSRLHAEIPEQGYTARPTNFPPDAVRYSKSYRPEEVSYSRRGKEKDKKSSRPTLSRTATDVY